MQPFFVVGSHLSRFVYMKIPEKAVPLQSKVAFTAFKTYKKRLLRER